MLLHFERSLELDAGSADVPVRYALPGGKYLSNIKIISRFALSADDTSAFPAKWGFLIMKLLHSRSFAREAPGVRMLESKRRSH